jgi:mono/diheme cytochrome c family protein
MVIGGGSRMSLSRVGSLSALFILLAGGCAESGPAQPSVQDTPIEVADAPAEDDNKEVPDAVGLPCNVKEFLAMNCQRCHGADAKNGTPLLTRDHLLEMAKKDPNAMVVERMLLRMSASEKPMPPVGKGDPVSAGNLEMFTAWVDEGLPAGHCDQEFTPPTPPPTPAGTTPSTPTAPASP